MPQTPRLTLTGVTAWIGAGRWRDGYAYGNTPRNYARPLSARSVMAPEHMGWRQAAVPTADLLRRTGTAGGRWSSLPRPIRAGVEAVDVSTPPPASTWVRNDARPPHRAHETRRSLPATPRIGQSAGTPYSISNETRRSRNDWFWTSGAGHINELARPVRVAASMASSFSARVGGERQSSGRAVVRPREASAWTGPGPAATLFA